VVIDEKPKKHPFGTSGGYCLDLYARVSTDDQNVKQQVEFLKEWVPKNGHRIGKVVSDTESGRIPLTERKKFRKLLEGGPESDSDGMLIVNLDRLTRNWDDVTLIERAFRENWEKYRLMSTGDGVDLSNASGRMMFRMKMVVNCYMPEDMREKQAVGIARAKKQGKYKGGKKGRSWNLRGSPKRVRKT
jgi:DNA invertase Pin-like site-specific DNA recombinase